MLVVRKEQIRLLEASGVEAFVIQMTRHLQEFFPDWSLKLGVEKLADFVRHGIERANRYGFRTELDLGRYLHVMQALGQDFDESPEHPWAAELLNREMPAAEKMDRLRDAADYQVEARRIRYGR